MGYSANNQEESAVSHISKRVWLCDELASTFYSPTDVVLADITIYKGWGGLGEGKTWASVQICVVPTKGGQMPLLLKLCKSYDFKCETLLIYPLDFPCIR